MLSLCRKPRRLAALAGLGALLALLAPVRPVAATASVLVPPPAAGYWAVDWAPQLNTPQGPYVAHLGRKRLYVGGDFTKVNGQHQPGFVMFPAAG